VPDQTKTHQYKMKPTKFLLTALAAAFFFSRAARADDGTLPPAATKVGVTYETDIKPIFAASCIRCHGDKRPGNGIVLTSLEGALKGGKDGKVILAGDSAHSDLVLSVAHVGDPDSFMPRGRSAKKLTDEQIGLIRAWIDQGAK
jgi:mono/diheme cytochrome c family protein